MRVTRLLALCTLLWVNGCGEDSDAESPMTKGQYCDSTGSAFCGRAEACELVSFDACFQGFKEGCCLNDASCDQQAVNTADLRALEKACVAALETEACSDVEAAVVPAACLMSP